MLPTVTRIKGDLVVCSRYNLPKVCGANLNTGAGQKHKGRPEASTFNFAADSRTCGKYDTAAPLIRSQSHASMKHPNCTTKNFLALEVVRSSERSN